MAIETGEAVFVGNLDIVAFPEGVAAPVKPVLENISQGGTLRTGPSGAVSSMSGY